MNFPLISIIIPVYNSEKYLSQCLDSVLAQTFSDFEIICICDAPTDNSFTVLQNYSKRDSRIRVVNNLVNQGVSRARNVGMQLAKGEYIYFLDSDDYILPTLLERTYKLAKDHKADIVSFGYYDERKIKQSNDVPVLDEIIITSNALMYLGSEFHDTVWSKLWKKSFVLKFNFISDIAYEDYVFLACSLRDNPNVVIVKDKLYYYRDNTLSVSNLKYEYKKKICHIGLMIIWNYYSEKKSSIYLKENLFPKVLKHARRIRYSFRESLALKILGVQKWNII